VSTFPDHALAQRTDDFPIGGFRKRFQRACPDVSQHAHLQVETRRHGIIRSFIDRDHVVVAHGEEKEFELAAQLLERFLCRRPGESFTFWMPWSVQFASMTYVAMTSSF